MKLISNNSNNNYRPKYQRTRDIMKKKSENYKETKA